MICAGTFSSFDCLMLSRTEARFDEAPVNERAPLEGAACASSCFDLADDIESARSQPGCDEFLEDLAAVPERIELVERRACRREQDRLPAFGENVYLVRPSGAVGVIKNVIPLRPDGSAISATIFGGHGIIEYRYNEYTKTQDWVSELTALPVPTRPSDLYYLNIM